MNDHYTLSNRADMCDLLNNARCCKIPGYWEGSSHGYHPCGLLINGILFRNDWNTNNYCSISIADNPNIEFHPAEDCPRAWHAQAVPKPKEGNLTTVWSNGCWVLEGPWKEKINEILYSVEQEISKRRNLEKEKKEREILENSLQKEQEMQSLTENWK